MKGSLHLGSPFGIGLYVHWTFGLLVAFLLVAGGGMASVVFVAAIFACITLHEYGHALAARRYGIPTHSVTLYPIGGIARLAAIPQNPKQELVIAIAGPAVNVAIAAVLIPLGLLLGSSFVPLANAAPETGAGLGFIAQLAYANITLVVFNLIPAFPMDGGRVFRAVLAYSGNYLWATHVAARTGQGIAVLFALAGLFYNPFLIILAAFVFMAAGAERRMAFIQQHQSRFATSTGPATPPPIPTAGQPVDPDWELIPPSRPRHHGGPPAPSPAEFQQIHDALLDALRRGDPHWNRPRG